MSFLRVLIRSTQNQQAGSSAPAPAVRPFLYVVAGMLFVSGGAVAQGRSVAGVWNASVTTPNGGGSPTLTFAVKGDSVTDSVKRPTGVVVPLRGTIKGSDLKK